MAADEPTSPEEWRPVVGYEDVYEVSNLGRVRRTRVNTLVVNRVLKPAQQTSGHLYVNLCRSNTPRTICIHVLVLAAFVGPRPRGMVSCHIDGDPTNNALSNLRYGTHSDNQMDRVGHGTSNRGERHALSKLTADDVRKMRSIRQADPHRTYDSIAAEFGVTRRTAARVITGRLWGHVT